MGFGFFSLLTLVNVTLGLRQIICVPFLVPDFSATYLLRGLLFFFFCDFLGCLAGFLFIERLVSLFRLLSTSGMARSHVSLIRCRGASVKLKPPRFDSSMWMLHERVRLQPRASQERVRVSRVTPCCGCKQRLSVFPPRSPLPLGLCSQKGCWEINLDFQLSLHLPLLRVGWFPWEPAPGYRE